MYGDCEAISSMGGNLVVSSETLFTSTFQNPNFTYLPLEPLPPMIPVSFFFVISCYFTHTEKKNHLFYVFIIYFWIERRKWVIVERKRGDEKWFRKWITRNHWAAIEEETLPPTHCSSDPRTGSVISFFFKKYIYNSKKSLCF